LPDRIVIGATALLDRGGAGLSRYTGELTRALLARDPALVAFTASAALRAEYGARVRRAAPAALAEGSLRGNVLRLLWHQFVLPRALKRERADLFYSTGADGMLVPPCPQVVTVHDVIPLRFPEANPRMQHYYRHVLPRVLAASAAVIAVSEATRRDLHRFYRLDDTPVHVVYQGYAAEHFRPCDTPTIEAARERNGLGEYLLAVGEARPYKNMDGLLEAFARARLPRMQLAIAGSLGGARERLLGRARALGIEARVRLLGYVPDAELAALYSGALAFAFPSFYEGFGIPPLEAMACGCPVIAADAASIPEVCGGAAVYADPYDADAFAAAITRVVGDDALRTALRQRGLERARRFSYAAAAERTLEVVRGVAELHAGRR
jgi:glycosyltransferase involved in cell wall biosynthesis